MHILLVTHHYAPEVGAPQRRWGALVPRFVAAGHRVTVLTPPPHYPSGTCADPDPGVAPGAVGPGEHGETVIRVRFRAHGPGLLSRSTDQAVAAVDSVMSGTRRLRRRGNRPDVVVATVPGIPSIGAGLALRSTLRAPLVVEMRDAWPDLIEPSGMMGPDGRRRGWKPTIRRAVHRTMTRIQRTATAVVTTTDGFAEVLRSRGIRRVEVIRNGAYLEEVPHLGRREGAGPLRVLYLGTVGRAQGLDAAVRAVGRLRHEGVGIELRIVGPGADYDRLLHVAWTHGAPVEMHGAVPRAEVFDHYRWADSLLVPLRSWEPLRWTVPSKLYEAMATGRHVTAAVDGEAADLVRETGAGHVVAPEDPAALAELWTRLAGERDLLRVDDRGTRWARAHSDYDTLADRYLALLRETVR